MMVSSSLPTKIASTNDNDKVTKSSTEPVVSYSLPAYSGIPNEVTSPNDVSGRYSLYRQQKDKEANIHPLPFCPESNLPRFLEHDRHVLHFHAYFEEDVPYTLLQSAFETKRIMKCQINFFVEDETIEIIQIKQQNSGIPQGVFLRRSKIEKPKSKSKFDDFGTKEDATPHLQEYYGIDDLKIGNVIDIYCHKFHIVDCNQSTREYALANLGWQQEDVTPLPFPKDSFEDAYKEKMMRESGVPGMDRKRKMNDLKEVMESMLGKQFSITDRGAFLECGQDALLFHAVWDDRPRLYGDLQFYRVVYYLADDTIEIFPIHKKNDGRYPAPKLLKRMKLPNNDAKSSDSDFVHWKDLGVGVELNVFGRSMLLANCDFYTRDYFAKHGIELKDDMPLLADEEKLKFVHHIPPHNGFGSEEDSLRSCTGGINPPPVKRDLAKMREKQGVVLCFNARLLSDSTNRRFVIQYFMEDDTMAVYEPPIRNSGIVGGKFLSRQVVKMHDGTKYQASDMFVGNIIDMWCHHFELLNADENTYRLMENDLKTFPFSDIDKVNKILSSKKEEICKYFATEYEGNGKINKEQLAACCENVGLTLNKQQIFTFWRKVDKKKKENISFTKVIQLL
jgi:hypothetical protein